MKPRLDQIRAHAPRRQIGVRGWRLPIAGVLLLALFVVAGTPTQPPSALAAGCNSPWPVPAGDDDCDGFGSSLEDAAGTLRLVACPVTAIANDEGSDAWPPDFNDDRTVDITDVLTLKPVFGTAVPPASPRLDLVDPGLVDISDVLALKPFFGITCEVPTAGGYTLVQDVTTANFNRMVDFAMIPGTTNEAVVVSQKEGVNNARIRRVALDGSFAPTIFGDLSGKVKTGGNEEGLLSLAFSPAYATDHRVYVYYTSASCLGGVTRCSRISRFPVVSNDMDESSETVVLEIDQVLNQQNHNGGRLLFGPDAYLSIGDGGGGGDPLETGQDNTDLLGSLLRIDVTGQNTYSIPADNPFVGIAGADELWAYGLRNPWRYSFDSVTGALWLADVGQNAWEEVEPIVKGGNYGWDCYEGFAAYETTGCPVSGFQSPRAVYDHSLGCSVTGGYVYRGSAMPELYGWYIYGDYCSGRIWAANAGDDSSPVLLADTSVAISSFAELPNGELLVLTFNNAIYRLAHL